MEVLAALNALPENERSAAALFYISGYSVAEVGEFLEVPVSTVKNRLYSALKRLRERMVATMEETPKQHASGDDFSERVREVLEGVPRVNFYDGPPRCPEDFTFPAALRACLEFIGEPSGCQHAPTYREGVHPRCTYAFINGTSGMAFRLLWNAKAWDFGIGNILHMAADPVEPIRRAFEAAGYGYEVIFKADFARQLHFSGACQDDEAYYRQRIVESLRDKGRPVMAIGVVGPPECCIITGYDERGDVLLGWSFFQAFPEFSDGIELEPSSYFRKRNWFRDTLGLILIGEKQERPPLAETHRRALRWALEAMRTPRVRHCHAGFAAYTAWTEALLRDEEFPAGNMDVLRKHYGVHYDAVGHVAEGRHYGAEFLAEMAGHEPSMVDELRAAEACFRTEHDLMWDVWNLAGGNAWTDEQALKLAESEVRRQIVPVILQARDKDVEAAQYIERALAM